MHRDFQVAFLEAVKQAVELDALSESDYAEIVGICTRANDRKIADVSEQIMIDAIGGESDGTVGHDG